MSLGQRGWRGTWARIAQEFQRRPATDDSLPIQPLEENFSPFKLNVAACDPQVSVIIPVHGQRMHTVACLKSISRCGAHARFEVIVVDDASPDDSRRVLAQIEGVRLIEHTRNLGFVDSCNDGAAAARGEFLLFLNNDTQVTPGWLDALLDCLNNERDCGIAGSRLVYPDGRLQEAGALVHADASCSNIGRFEDRNDPRFRFRREVDYVSGAALMISRTLFTRVGGFASDFAPAYYEDTDLAFAVRAAGLRVVYEPRSLVVHFEGITAGTQIESGVKRHQALNRTRFYQRRRQALAAHSAPGTPIESGLRRYVHGRMLVIDSTVPEPARDSASLRLVSLFGLLQDMGWQVIFAPDDGRADNQHIEALGALGVQVVCQRSQPGLSTWLPKHGHALDAVMLCRAGIGDQYLAIVRRHAPNARVLFDTVDLHFLRESRAAELAANDTMRRQAQASRRRELRLIERSDVTFVVSPVERDMLSRARPHARVELLSNVHEVHGRRAPFEQRKDLVFVGGFGHPPNADAVRWLVEDIMPRLDAHEPALHLHLLGDVPDDVRGQLSAPRVHVHGRVEDLAPFMDSCRVALAPLRFGAGVKGKVNMAMSYGLPVVATPVAAEGMQLADGRDVLIAREADAFAAAVLRLYDDPQLWLRLSDAGLDNVRLHFSPAAAAKTLHHVLD